MKDMTCMLTSGESGWLLARVLIDIQCGKYDVEPKPSPPNFKEKVRSCQTCIHCQAPNREHKFACYCKKYNFEMERTTGTCDGWEKC